MHNKEEHLKRELKKRRVNIQGGKGLLMQRYRELSINVDNERFRAVPRNIDTIVRQLNHLELLNNQIAKDIENDMEKAKKILQKIKQEFVSRINK